MIKNVITYSMEFYKNDRNYKKKLEKNILNITLTGTVREVDVAGRPINPENNKTFSLTEDIHLPNINQILISKHLEGSLDEITAIAYNDEIVHGEHSNKPDKMTFVFAFDNSGSMNWKMKRTGPNTSNLSRRRTAYNALTNFIKDLHQSGIQNDIKIDLYLFTYGDHTMINQPSHDENFPYLYKLSDLEGSDVVIKGRHANAITKRISYGPYKLGKDRTTADEDALKKHIKEVCKLDQDTWDHDIGASTNTGKALLQSLEILNQVR
ncbi:MAG: hypothetical protein Q3993_08765, partial [Filifactor alocis]|nr:hypothetical protein [Filifactor alocis]